MLRNYTPSTSELNAIEPASSEGGTRLVLTVPMNAIGKMHSKEYFNTSYNSLVLQWPTVAVHANHGLTIRAAPRISTQQIETVKSALVDSWRKAAEGFNVETEHTFDVTALSYVLGFTTMRSAFNQPIAMGRAASVGLLEEKAFCLANNDFIILKHMYSDPYELYTLLCLVKSCGIDNAYLAVPGLEQPVSRHLMGKALALYCCRLQKMIEATADVCSCFAHHSGAFFRGMTAACTLRAHSDEGGYIRNVLKLFSGPRLSGVITERPRSNITAEPWTLALEGVRKWALDTFLVGVACTVAADPCSEVDGTYYPACPEHASLGYGTVADRDQTWLHYPTLRGLTEDWFSKFLTNLTKAYGKQRVTTEANHSLQYFNFRNADGSVISDRHLREWRAAVFVWIEPGTVCFDEVRPLYQCPTLTQPMVVKLWTGEVYRSSTYREERGHVATGSVQIMAMHGTNLRSQGVFYLLNNKWNPQDGLANFRITHTPSKGATNNPAYAATDGRDLAELSWYLWDTCMPHPLNCLTTNREVVFFRHVAVYPKCTPTVDEWNTDVSVSVGVMSVGTAYDPKESRRSSRAVPPYYINALRRLDPYTHTYHTDIDEAWSLIPDVLGHAGTLPPQRYADSFGGIEDSVDKLSMWSLIDTPSQMNLTNYIGNTRPRNKAEKPKEVRNPQSEWGYRGELGEHPAQTAAPETQVADPQGPPPPKPPDILFSAITEAAETTYSRDPPPEAPPNATHSQFEMDIAVARLSGLTVQDVGSRRLLDDGMDDSSSDGLGTTVASTRALIDNLARRFEATAARSAQPAGAAPPTTAQAP